MSESVLSYYKRILLNKNKCLVLLEQEMNDKGQMTYANRTENQFEQKTYVLSYQNLLAGAASCLVGTENELAVSSVIFPVRKGKEGAEEIFPSC